MLEYSPTSARARAFLFQHYNDIDVYVEDTVSHNMYVVLINRLLEAANLSVQYIIQVGNREQVLTECTEDQAEDGRPRIYIIDGDYQAVIGKPAPNLKHLYQLGVFTSENLLICIDAITEVAFECLSNMPREQVKAIIAMEAYLQGISEILTPLFVAYTVAWMLNPDIKTCGYNVMALCEQVRGGEPRLSREKVQERIDEVVAALQQSVPEADISEAFSKVGLRFSQTNGRGHIFISGKTYLLHLIFHHLQRSANLSGTIEQLKVRLARFCRLDADPGLGRALLNAVSWRS